ncbi:unnamed protein product [Paramecium primaurelia]|uniref:Transmembrane protein n=1 Tax=Paramecium primaurelia TaxID=5886 RepID=A0A8S1KR01_PARPR|nr:unnamed protein product [Paramecium primaurelia]
MKQINKIQQFLKFLYLKKFNIIQLYEGLQLTASNKTGFNQQINSSLLDNFFKLQWKLIKFLRFCFCFVELITNLRDMYFGIYYGDICNELGFDRKDLCYQIIEGNLELGIFNVEQYYLQYFRYQLSINQNYQIAYDPYIYQLDQSLYNYIRKSVDQVQSYQLSMMTNQMDSTLNIQLILVIIFILVLLLIFVIYWFPFLTSTKSQINQNIQMLNMIPKMQLKIIRQLEDLQRIQLRIRIFKIYYLIILFPFIYQIIVQNSRLTIIYQIFQIMSQKNQIKKKSIQTKGLDNNFSQKHF